MSLRGEVFRRDNLNRVVVWEKPVRVFHWAHVVSIGLLGFTGAFIGSPFLSAPADATSGTNMAWIRMIHFVAAWVFTLGFVYRLYWLFVGNKYASWRDWIPSTESKWVFAWKQFKYYAFLQKERPHYLGHNPIAGLSYAAVCFLILLQAISGWALYTEATQGGIGGFLFGWMLNLFGDQYIRLFHHALMYVFGMFFIIHFYLCVLGDVEEKNGMMSSIFGGTKFDKPRKEHHY